MVAGPRLVALDQGSECDMLEAVVLVVGAAKAYQAPMRSNYRQTTSTVMPHEGVVLAARYNRPRLLCARLGAAGNYYSGQMEMSMRAALHRAGQGVPVRNCSSYVALEVYLPRQKSY